MNSNVMTVDTVNDVLIQIHSAVCATEIQVFKLETKYKTYHINILHFQ